MQFRTQIPIEPSAIQFGYEDKILLLGSCFAKNIGSKLDYFKFQSVTNPFGIIFNPIAMERLIEDAVLDKTYTEKDVFEHEGIWKSFYAHSSKNSLSRLGAVIHLQESQQLLREQLKAASHVFITLGTAWIYRHRKSEEVVANCHKVPQKEFEKELLSVDDIAQSLSKMTTLVKAINPNANITFTVSPVRHLKDGYVENTRSKAHLIAAVHEIVDQKSVIYFPAYEILMDELRDYRFYANDMLHPSQQAVDYIWEKFVAVYAFAKAQKTMKEVSTIQMGLLHKPFNENSEQHQNFVKKLHQQKENLQNEYPHMRF